MKKIMSIFIAFMFSSHIMGQESTKKNETLELFEKLEIEMQNHYDKLNNEKIFEDPLGRVYFLFETIKKYTLSLITNTTDHKKELLNLLVSSSLDKNTYMDSDITYILYNLDIDNYITVLQTVLNFYKEDKIEFDIFDRFIFQDFIVSNMIAKNYQNKNLAYYLDSLLSDKELKNKMGIKFKPFQESIINLKSGISWNGLKILDEIQSPILETLNYE